MQRHFLSPPIFRFHILQSSSKCFSESELNQEIDLEGLIPDCVRDIADHVEFLTRFEREAAAPNKVFSIDWDSTGCGWPVC